MVDKWPPHPWDTHYQFSIKNVFYKQSIKTLLSQTLLSQTLLSKKENTYQYADKHLHPVRAMFYVNM